MTATDATSSHTTETPSVPFAELKTEDQARRSFTEHTAEHVMTVLHDDSLYRHLRFRKPGTGIFGFDVVTWPGHIAISGDMGDTTMARIDDMIGFVAKPGSDRISFGYWAEKIVANEGPKREWSQRLLEAQLRDSWREQCEERGVDHDSDLATRWWDDLTDAILNAYCGYGNGDERAQREALDRFAGDIELYETWEWDCSDYPFHLYWRMLALRYAANTYLASKEA